MSVTASAAAKEEQSVAAAESESQEKTNSNDDRTVYQNQKVIDAVDEGITYKVGFLYLSILRFYIPVLCETRG